MSPPRHRAQPHRPVRLVGSVLIVLLVLAGCSDDDGGGDTATGAGSTPGTIDQKSSDENDEPTTGGELPEPCSLVSTDQVAGLLDPAAREPVTVALVERVVLGDCGYKVSNTFVGASYIYVHLRSASGLEDARQVTEADDIEEVAGLGDEAITFTDPYIGPELWVRRGDISFGVTYSRFEIDAGMTRESRDELAALVLAALD